MPHIFISYAKKDTRELALALADAFNALSGYTAWVDRSLRAGKSWETQIQTEIDRCDVFIVLYSPDLNRHKQGAEESYVLTEIAYAHYTVKKPIIPVMAQKTDPPITLARMHYIDYTLPGLKLSDLVDALCDEMGTTESPAPAPARGAGGGAERGAAHDEIIVAQIGSAHHRSIGEALQQAPSGATIRVRPGIYREHLKLTKAVALIADGAQSDVVIEGSTDNTIHMQTDFAQIQGFTIRLRPTDSDLKRACIFIPQGRLLLEDCDITSGALAGVEIRNLGTDSVLRRCRVANCNQNGVMVWENATGLIEDCDITGNTYSGVEIKTQGNPTVRKCRINEGKQGGVLVWQDGSGLIEDCDIIGNALAGVEIREKGSPTVRRCRVADGRQGGIYIHSSGVGLIDDCDVSGNAYSGIQIRTEASPTVRKCRIVNGRQSGVLVNENGAGVIEDCDIVSNDLAGVQIKTQGNPTVRKCRIADGKQGGVLVNESGTGLFEDCDITGNAYAGVEIREKGSPTLRKCRIKHNVYQAIYAHTDGRGVIEGCDLRENNGGAWFIKDDSQLTRRDNLE